MITQYLLPESAEQAVAELSPGVAVMGGGTTVMPAVHVGALSLAGCRVPEEDRLLGGSSFDAALERFFLRAVLTSAARQVARPCPRPRRSGRTR